MIFPHALQIYTATTTLQVPSMVETTIPRARLPPRKASTSEDPNKIYVVLQSTIPSSEPQPLPPCLTKGVFSNLDDAVSFMHSLKEHYPPLDEANYERFANPERIRYGRGSYGRGTDWSGQGYRYKATDGREHAFWWEEMVLEPDLESRRLASGKERIDRLALQEQEVHTWVIRRDSRAIPEVE